MKRIVLVAVAAFGISTTANAADQPVKGPVYKAAPAVFNWTGWYAGIDVGHMNSKGDVFNTGIPATAQSDPDGWLAGGHVGYRWQRPGSRWVWGVEADLWGGDIYGETQYVAVNTAPLDINFGGSIRGTFGIALSPTLIYATAGASFIDFDGCTAVALGTGCVAGTNYSDTRWGWTVGVGIVHAFSPRWTARLEYLYADYGNEVYVTPAVAGGTTALDLQTHTIRAGISWRFSM